MTVNNDDLEETKWAASHGLPNCHSYV